MLSYDDDDSKSSPDSRRLITNDSTLRHFLKWAKGQDSAFQEPDSYKE
jgi:hypothetical protein